MNILHYALGFPPYRTGGLTKFCMDLMYQQYQEGHMISLLWPGEMSLLHSHTVIKNRGKNGVINSYELINPTPVSYDEGITEIDAFMLAGDKITYQRFLNELHPDIIHVHTLMGIHKSFLLVAKELHIRIVFSAHDFFPICPKVTMFRSGKICSSIENCENCATCNATALSLNKIKLLQSGVYRALKDSYVVKKLRKRHRDDYLSESAAQNNNGTSNALSAVDYQKLRSYYRELIELVDIIHYNSSVTQSVYEKYLQLTEPLAVLIPITHADIQDCKKRKQFTHGLRITYLGPAGGAKGYFLLREALDKLWNDKESGRRDFCLNVYFQPEMLAPYMKVHGKYSYDQLEIIFENTDILIAPSICNETFGYTVLEALSFGVPVIISDTVGAKDTIPEGAGIVIEDITAEKLSKCIMQINTEKLKSMNEVVVNNFEVPTLASMSEVILKKCYLYDGDKDETSQYSTENCRKK